MKSLPLFLSLHALSSSFVGPLQVSEGCCKVVVVVVVVVVVIIIIIVIWIRRLVLSSCQERSNSVLAGHLWATVCYIVSRNLPPDLSASGNKSQNGRGVIADNLTEKGRWCCCCGVAVVLQIWMLEGRRCRVSSSG